MKPYSSIFGTAEIIMPKYIPVPNDLDLRKVVVIHRHGDRAQIAKSLGERYPESAELTKKWHSLLPSERLLRGMLLAGNPGDATVLTKDEYVDVTKTVYNGLDKTRLPYAQLTEVGSIQMSLVGTELRERYVENLIPSELHTANDHIYCRTTNMCRTSQSLRSLLVGLYDIDPDMHTTGSTTTNIHPSALEQLPTIHTRPYEEETLAPRGTMAMLNRRASVLPPNTAPSILHPHEYAEFEARTRRLLGFNAGATDGAATTTTSSTTSTTATTATGGGSTTHHRINWATVMEVLHCHRSHGIEHIKGFSDEDLQKAAKISAWNWGVLYKVYRHNLTLSCLNFFVCDSFLSLFCSLFCAVLILFVHLSDFYGV
jgi:hypothetical protein